MLEYGWDIGVYIQPYSFAIMPPSNMYHQVVTLRQEKALLEPVLIALANRVNTRFFEILKDAGISAPKPEECPVLVREHHHHNVVIISYRLSVCLFLFVCLLRN